MKRCKKNPGWFKPSATTRPPATNSLRRRARRLGYRPRGRRDGGRRLGLARLAIPPCARPLPGGPARVGRRPGELNHAATGTPRRGRPHDGADRGQGRPLLHATPHPPPWRPGRRGVAPVGTDESRLRRPRGGPRWRPSQEPPRRAIGPPASNSGRHGTGWAGRHGATGPRLTRADRRLGWPAGEAGADGGRAGPEEGRRSGRRPHGHGCPQACPRGRSARADRPRPLPGRLAQRRDGRALTRQQGDPAPLRVRRAAGGRRPLLPPCPGRSLGSRTTPMPSDMNTETAKVRPATTMRPRRSRRPGRPRTVTLRARRPAKHRCDATRPDGQRSCRSTEADLVRLLANQFHPLTYRLPKRLQRHGYVSRRHPVARNDPDPFRGDTHVVCVAGLLEGRDLAALHPGSDGHEFGAGPTVQGIPFDGQETKRTLPRNSERRLHDRDADSVGACLELTTRHSAGTFFLSLPTKGTEPWQRAAAPLY